MRALRDGGRSKEIPIIFNDVGARAGDSASQPRIFGPRAVRSGNGPGQRGTAIDCAGQVAGSSRSMKLPANKRLVTDHDGKKRIITVVNPRLDTSAKIRQKTSKRQRVVKRPV
jgi:hypothetical protein